MMSLRGVAAGSRNRLLLQRTMLCRNTPATKNLQQPNFHLQRRSSPQQQCKNYNHHANNNYNYNNGSPPTSNNSYHNQYHHNHHHHNHHQYQYQQQKNQYHQNDIYNRNNSNSSYQLSNPDEFGFRDLLINPAAYFWVGVFGISIYNIVQIPNEFKP